MQGYVAVGYMCNQKCSFCPCSAGEKKYRIPPLDELKRTIYAMREGSGIDSIVVSGGEPTLHPDFIGFIKFLCEEGLKVTILSNSEKFSNLDFTSQFSKVADKKNVDLITTIHSHIALEHEKVNGSKGSFERSISGMLSVQNKGYHITVKHCITKANKKGLLDFYRFVVDRFPDDADVQLCSIDYCGLTDKNKYDFMVSFPELYDYFEEMFDAYIEDLENGSTRHVYCINIPLCSMDPYYWDYVAPKNTAYSDYASPTKDGKSIVAPGDDGFIGTFGEGCRMCKVESLCAGTYRTAFEYFGDKIIHPYIV